MKIEKHPLQPFFPDGAKWLFLGSFPPKRQRWSMEFYYPNFQNDMWRIFGLVFFEDKDYFIDIDKKSFKKEAIEAFLTKHKIALYDTAKAVIRHSDNASDKDLEIVEATDIIETIRELYDLQNIAATGQKAMDTIIAQLTKAKVNITPPTVGSYASFTIDNRDLRLYRMPSSSRAYPLALEKKAAIYKKMLIVVQR
jgi:G:T/U-mismatch repair DNA glycosylase